MSATTQNDSFFIKGLDLSVDSVKNPLKDDSYKWSGEKMIILPSLISEELNREEIIAWLAKEKYNKGIVAIVPSFEKGKEYSSYGAIMASNKNIFECILNLKTKNDIKTLVIANRYDGIDLPDNACRVLIIDSLPYFDSLSDKYEEICRPNSDVINVKIAQKIEQGLGRSVRGEKDYSAILLIGSDLVRFVNCIETKKFFSNQTQKQIDIGFEIVDMSREEFVDEPEKRKIVENLLKQLIDRDANWKEYYDQSMSEIESEEDDFHMHNILIHENKAEKYFENGEYESAIEEIQKVIDSISDDLEKGWYLQEMARYKYRISSIEANRLQNVAFKKNDRLLKPKEGVSYKKIEYIN